MGNEKLLLKSSNGNWFSQEDWFRGLPVFLLLNGPSLKRFKEEGMLDLLRDRGILTCGVNNGWSVHRPNLWVGVDPPGVFMDGGWKDGNIHKYMLQGRLDDFIYEKVGEEFKPTTFRCKDMPAVMGYPGNTNFNVDSFLTEPTVNYGMNQKNTDSLGNKGSRSVMLAALRLLHYLGFRRVFIVGADFHMRPDQPYAFVEAKDEGACKNNNDTYRILNSRLKALRPKFEEAGFSVYNCSGPESRLEAFDRMDFMAAVDSLVNPEGVGGDTKGWYRKVEGEVKPVINPGRQRYRYRRVGRQPGGRGKVR